MADVGNVKFRIDTNQRFEAFAHPPVAEAVIKFGVAPLELPDREVLRQQLSTVFPDYPAVQDISVITAQVQLGLNRPPRPSSVWSGFRLTKSAETGAAQEVVQVLRDGLAFSRLEPYTGWEAFENRALSAWSHYQSLAQPAEIDRLSVRFVTRVPIKGVAEVEELLSNPPQRPRGLEALPLADFLFQSEFRVPNYPLALATTRMVQPMPGLELVAKVLVIDINVNTTTPVPIEGEQLKLRLAEMRWLKNAAFFGSITETAKARYARKSE